MSSLEQTPVEPIFLRPVTSDGRTGQQFVASLKKANYNVGDQATYCMTKSKDVNGNLAFVSTTGITYKPVVILGEQFEDDDRITSNIRKLAGEKKYITPPAELAPLLREEISDEDIEKMGLWRLVVMHEPIADSVGCPLLLGVGRYDRGRFLRAYDGRPTDRWDRVFGFVFLAPQENLVAV